MNTLAFYLFYAINWVITLLPLRVLYIFSDLLFIILYHFPSYRRNVVFENLKNSFPGKSHSELRLIEKKFYRHLSDVFIETLKLTHIGSEEMKKRYIITNAEVLEKLKKEGRDIAAVCGHYNNWEWLSATPLYTDLKCVTIYRPLSNKHFDKFINNLRRKKGFFVTPNSNIVRDIITNRKNGENALYAFIADQVPPKGDIKYWTSFLNQDTPVYLGVEKIALKYDMAVLFFNMQKIRRGYYTSTIEVLFEHTSGLREFEITEAHVRCLEKMIIDNPEFWTWSHKRWKHKRDSINV
jgi:Kdo2-lipid IVA lauroyltransferase/acyltransferase